MENQIIMARYDLIRSELEKLGLYDDRSLILIRDDMGRVALDADGRRSDPAVFGVVRADLAVLTCGRYSGEYARSGKTISASNDDMAMMFGPKVRCVDKPKGNAPAYIIRDRGFIVTGRFVSELIAACVLIEKMCKAEILAPRIGRIRHLAPPLCTVENTVYLKKYSKKAKESSSQKPAKADEKYGTVPDLELRKEVIRYGKMLVENRLIQATWGNVSVRVDEDRFLITPSGVNYDLIKPEEIVEVCIADGSYEEGLHPSSERKLHRLVYRERQDIKAIIHTHSSNCQVFAACHSDLKTENEEYPCAGYAVSGSGKLAKNVAEVMKEHNGCIMANHGFAAGGTSLGDAMDRAVAAENGAGKILGA